MLEDTRSTLDYRQLVNRSRRLVRGNGRELRVALLAEVSTQHLVPLLSVLFADQGFDATIYEAGFDTIELEAYNSESELYRFKPQIVIVLQSLQKAKAAYYDFEGDRISFAPAVAQKQEDIWKAIQARLPVPVIQNTFPLPYERQFGNFDLKIAGTLLGAVSEVNRELGLRARLYPSVLLCDLDYLAAWFGRRHFIDEKLWALSKAICSLDLLPEVAQALVDVALAAQGRAVKCVVVDLDGTLWGGVVGDDGLEGIGLGDLDDGGAFRFFQLYLRELARRGVLLAVCSKNDESLARRVFREHPGMVLKEEHFAAFVANWEDKATNLRRIAESLNLGLDAFVFLDDSAFERNLVRQILPEVIVPEMPGDPALYARCIAELNLFEVASYSSLDARRGALYQDQQRREAERRNYAGIGDYLQSLQTIADFRRFSPGNLGRIAQLIQRSNQFNLTTRRLSEAECAAVMDDPAGFFPFSISIQDRVGDFGLVSVVILKNEFPALRVDVFVMSCRVLQRGIEQFAMNKIFEHARQGGYKRVDGLYRPTPKNMMVKEFYAQFGFGQKTGPIGEGVEWSLAVEAYTPRPHFIREVTDPAPTGVPAPSNDRR
jgi:FkbH-like protein